MPRSWWRTRWSGRTGPATSAASTTSCWQSTRPQTSSSTAQRCGTHFRDGGDGTIESSSFLLLRTASSAPPSAAASPPAPSSCPLSWPSPDCWQPPPPPPAAGARARGRWTGEREVRRRKKACRGWKESGKGKGKS